MAVIEVVDAARRPPTITSGPFSPLLFPVPRRMVVLPAVALAVATAAFTAVGQQWAFVSLPHASGLPRASLQITGPFVAAVVAAVSAALTNRARPTSSAAAARFDNALPIRVWAIMTITSCGGFLVGGGVGVAVLVPQAAAGSPDYLELVTSPLQLMWIMALGFLVGRLWPRWFGPIVAVVAVALYTWILPVLVDPLLPSTMVSVGQEFLFPGTPAWQHEPFRIHVYAALMAWWILATAALVLVALRWSGIQSGTRRWRRAAPAACAATVAYVGVVVVVQTPLFGPLASESPVCTTESGVTVCLSAEEVSQDAPVRAAALAAMSRVAVQPSETDPVEVRSVQADTREPAEGDPFVVPVTSTDGADGVFSAVAGQLAGLDHCPPGEWTTSIHWSLALTQWIDGDITPATHAADEITLFFRDQPQEEIAAWYAANEAALTACAYDGGDT